MDVSVIDRQRGHKVGIPALRAFLDAIVRIVPPGDADELSVTLVSDRRMRALNRTWRGRDRTTDVLSFPGGESPAGAVRRSLGDIVISTGRAAVQAREAGHSLAREIKVLALHGYLHLLGFDHETDDGTMMRKQRSLERRLLPPTREARR
jgi:probable rRNA maturation factor